MFVRRIVFVVLLLNLHIVTAIRHNSVTFSRDPIEMTSFVRLIISLFRNLLFSAFHRRPVWFCWRSRMASWPPDIYIRFPTPRRSGCEIAEILLASRLRNRTVVRWPGPTDHWSNTRGSRGLAFRPASLSFPVRFAHSQLIES